RLRARAKVEVACDRAGRPVLLQCRTGDGPGIGAAKSELCGAAVGVPCMLVAVDDVFSVPVPTLMRAIGFFHPAADTSIAVDARHDVMRKLAEASTGWNAVAVGSAGRPGLALKAANEQAAIDGALADCGKRDSSCRVVAIGPFAVAPN